VSQRGAVTWAATSVPEIRRQWCNAMATLVDRTTCELLDPALMQPGMAKQLKRMQDKLAATAIT
jgi:hypothetical protein